VKTKVKTVAREARLIVRGALKGALATTRRAARPEAKGQPYVSKVGVAVGVDGAPLFLFSTLAAHTQDLMADSRASVLLEAPSDAQNPLEGARCTLVGRVEKLPDDEQEAARDLYLAHHPGAALYAGFGDFALWRMEIDKIHYVGGFGVAKWLKAADYLTSAPDIAAARETLLISLNEGALADLRTAFAYAAKRSARGWKALEVDADGVTLAGPKGKHMRLDFKSPARDLKSWRGRFQTLVKRVQR